MNQWKFLRGLKILVCVVLGVFLVSYITSALWNNLIPVLFNGPVISMGQALGLLVLGRLFFGSFGGRRGGCNNCGPGWRGGHWRKRFEEKLSSMSPEEREKLRQKMNQKCGPWFGSSENMNENKD